MRKQTSSNIKLKSYNNMSEQIRTGVVQCKFNKHTSVEYIETGYRSTCVRDVQFCVRIQDQLLTNGNY